MDASENVVSPQLQNLANGEILIKQDLVVPDFPTNGDMSILVMWDLIRYIITVGIDNINPVVMIIYNSNSFIRRNDGIQIDPQ
jgi:hypothetical protein